MQIYQKRLNMLNYFKKTLTSKEIRIQIGKRLHNERVKANLSLDKLAELTGFSKPTVQRWEKGWKNGTGENIIPTLDQIIELCAIYNCSPGYLLCEYDERTRQAFDASLELGLTDQSIQHLQLKAINQVDTLHPASGDLFLCFLNFFICNSDYLSDILRDRQHIENNDRQMNYLPGIKIVKDTLNHPDIQRILFKIRDFSDTDEKAMEIKRELVELLRNHYKKYETPELSVGHLLSTTLQYYNHVFPNARKQSDFLISDTFVNIARKYFEKSYEEIDSYNKFVNAQKHKKAELDPEFFSHLHYAIFK